ncbi:MAG: hypothetical protein IKK06_02055 [Clostridia bacterium]|nr:hypothetical protein [Clostridia bacterium]
MPKKLIKPGILLATVFVVISLLFVTAGATTVNVLDGQVSITDSANSNTVSGGTVTITAKGSLWGKKTNNITITNETDSKAKLSFDYTVEKANSFTIAGVNAAASGSYSADLEAGGTLSITLVSNSGLSNTTATLKLSNIGLTAIADSSNVTFDFDSNLGGVTVDGVAVDDGEVKNISGNTGATLVATANGSTFLGWVDEDGKILSTATSYTLTPAADMTVKAAFAKDGGTPWFGVGVATSKTFKTGFLNATSNTYYTVESYTDLFDNLSDAADAANKLNSKVIVPLNNGTLPAGDYTIPTGVTLLIPFDSTNTMYTTVADSVKDYTEPKAYRTLTLSQGANLTINGSMSVSAKHRYTTASSYSGGSPVGNVGFVKMNEGSSITVGSGGALYVYGYITGSGTITAENNSSIYELFQIADFRGGSQTTQMKNEVFPLSQYYVQNIEVPLKLEKGATEFAYTTIYMSSTKFGTPVEFVGSSGMFRVTDGYAIKKYDGSKDRLMMEVSGTASIASISLAVSGTTIRSADYVLPINNNISLTVRAGSNITVAQDLALLPGSEVLVEETATVTVNEGYKIIAYDVDQWGTYCGSTNQTIMPLKYVPGRTGTRKAADLVDASVCVNGTIVATAGSIYTTSGGANVYSTGTGVVKLTAGTQTVTYQLVQNTGYTEIPLTLAKLKNADGKYVTPKVADTFTYTNGKWVCTVHTLVGAAEATATNGATYSLNCGTGCGECLASVTVAYRLRDYLWLNATVTNNFADRGVTFAMDGAQTVGSYVIRSVSAAEISNSLSLTFTYNSVSCSLEMNLARYKEMITDNEDIALINTLLAYGEAAEDSFAGNVNEKPAGVTRPAGLPGELIVFEEQAGSVSSGSQASNVTVSRYGMTIGFGNCLQFIYGFRVNDAAGITDWSNIVEIGLLYSDVAGTLEAKKENFAYVLYQNPVLVKDSENLPQGVVPTPKPTDTTLSQDDLESMWSTNDGIYMIAYNMVYEDYGKSYNYRPYILYADGSVAYGEQFAYSLTTYIGNRLNSTANAPSDTEKTLLYATWNLKEAVATWLSAKESAT